MGDQAIPDRRKNPARKKPIDLAYQGTWNAERRTFDIFRAGAPTGNFARDRATAVGLAIREAEKDAKEGSRWRCIPGSMDARTQSGPPSGCK